MDLDGDGVRDVLTGSWPGELYIFKGVKGEDGKATFAAPTKLTDKDGKEIHTGNASVLHAVDWDADGDLDLVVGSIEGWVWLVPNESGGKALTFGAPVKIEADGKPIQQDHSGPTVADWDGNGTLDLIVGQGDGSVVWYANTAKEGAPTLAAAQVLHRGSRMGDGSKPGGRAKPCVVDWNGDGQLDLLFGDFGMKQPEKRDLSELDQARLDAYTAERLAVSEKMQPYFREATAKALRAIGVEVDPDDSAAMGKIFKDISPEKRKEYTEHFAQAVKEAEGLKALQDRLQELHKLMQPLQGTPTVLGYVWFCERFDPAAAGAAAGKAACKT